MRKPLIALVVVGVLGAVALSYRDGGTDAAPAPTGAGAARATR